MNSRDEQDFQRGLWIVPGCVGEGIRVRLSAVYVTSVGTRMCTNIRPRLLEMVFVRMFKKKTAVFLTSSLGEWIPSLYIATQHNLSVIFHWTCNLVNTSMRFVWGLLVWAWVESCMSRNNERRQINRQQQCELGLASESWRPLVTGRKAKHSRTLSLAHCGAAGAGHAAVKNGSCAWKARVRGALSQSTGVTNGLCNAEMLSGLVMLSLLLTPAYLELQITPRCKPGAAKLQCRGNCCLQTGSNARKHRVL